MNIAGRTCRAAGVLPLLYLLATPERSMAQSQEAASAARPGSLLGDQVLSQAARSNVDPRFRAAVATAVDRHPAIGEAQAQQTEAEAARREARAQLLPSADLSVTSFKVISREFRNALDNIVLRSLPTARTDVTAVVTQPLFNFGATQNRIAAASARLEGAAAQVDNAAEQIALNTINAWYGVYRARLLVAITQEFRQAEEGRREDIQLRIAQGAQAEADIARLDSAVAAIDTRLASYRRELEAAEARYRELTGALPPADLRRAPDLGRLPASAEEARLSAENNASAVITARAQAEAARRDQRAARADTRPNLSAGLDAGRYGVFEYARDYDIRARVTLRQRLGGGLDARADQFRARAQAADARLSRIREESGRDAAIAFADLSALDRQLGSLAEAYSASVRTRDAIAQRFRFSRGTLFDVLGAADSYFAATTSYVDTLVERDAARYVLLARTGTLLNALDLPRVSKSQSVR
jgi:outer membrane protein, adhesin transport system